MAGVLKPVRWSLTLLALLGLGSPAAAMPPFRLTAIQQLGYDKLDPLWQYSGKVMSCTFCHVNKQGGAPWNPFGEALRRASRRPPPATSRRCCIRCWRRAATATATATRTPWRCSRTPCPATPPATRRCRWPSYRCRSRRRAARPSTPRRRMCPARSRGQKRSRNQGQGRFSIPSPVPRWQAHPPRATAKSAQAGRAVSGVQTPVLRTAISVAAVAVLLSP